MNHVVLLGDSIFDNAAYVSGRPAVIDQLRNKLAGSKASLLAVDGDVTADVRGQLRRLPADTSHLVVSVGGNDALRVSSILSERASSVAEALGRLAEARDQFAAEYRQMADALEKPGLPTAVSTIYDANYPPPYGRLVVAALTLFNDVITRVAFERGFDLVDLRLICSDAADYANPIEPSSIGGDKITGVIARMVASQRGEAASGVWVR